MSGCGGSWRRGYEKRRRMRFWTVDVPGRGVEKTRGMR
nr:MAG TPA: hypothetical protein [Caudoviricetes sp.]